VQIRALRMALEREREGEGEREREREGGRKGCRRKMGGEEDPRESKSLS
jgi:hypothetical protein